ncbi:MAG: hypothetical protein J0M07_32615 [Anaerolineae bacterium]|nr:hypothetical protein [Anaerolineae bacterium]
MNSLTSVFDQLAVALTADPLLLLASAVAAFDPFWNAFDEESIDYDAEPLHIAVQVTRGAFPDIYAEAVERLRAGAAYQEMDRLLCTAISAKGIPLDDLEAIGWGIPLHAVGVDLEDPEFYSVHSDLLPILAPFGIDIPEGEIYSVDVPECVYSVGHAIAASLLEQTDPALRQVGWAFGWLFSCTGNSLIDYTEETLAEIPPLSWSAEDVAFAIELIEEADGIMADALAGLKHLMASPDLVTAVKKDVACHSGKSKTQIPVCDYQ